MSVAVVGAGKLGAPLAAILAANKDHVFLVDVNDDTVELINRAEAPVVEPGLEHLLELAHPWLRATTSMDRAVEESDLAFVVVPTPSDATGRFTNVFVLEAVERIGAALTKTDKPWYTVVVVSTVMPGSMRGPIREALEATSGRICGIDVGLAYNPAFIALGSVIHDFQHPDMVLIGADDPVSARNVKKVLAPVVETNTWHELCSIDAEIAKISLNLGLVTKISYANTIAEYCENIDGADARAVLRVVGSDSRIGPKFLQPGGPAGGPCLPRDAMAWYFAAQEAGVDAPLVQAVHEVNRRQALRIAGRAIDDKRVGILGLTYKPNTPVTDDALGGELVKILSEWDVAVETFDPLAQCSMQSAQELVEWANTIIVATACSEFAGIDYGDARVIDVWGILPPEDNIERIGES